MTSSHTLKSAVSALKSKSWAWCSECQEEATAFCRQHETQELVTLEDAIQTIQDVIKKTKPKRPISPTTKVAGILGESL